MFFLSLDSNLESVDAKFSSFLEYSKQELYVITCPFLCFSAVLLAVGIYFYDPLTANFVYSIVPKDYQNNWTFFIILCFEVFAVTFWVNSANFVIFFQISFFQKCTQIADSGLKKIR